MEYRVIGDVAYVTTTDIRQDFVKIYKQILAKYDTVVIERNGRPVAVLRSPAEIEAHIRTESV